MEYREIGKTGLKAGVVGMGAEHLDGKPYNVVESTIHAALDAGINIMDVFMPGEEIRKHIGKALAGRRDKVMLQGMIGSVDLNKQYDITRDLELCKKYFSNLLRDLHTDYIDFGMLFFMDTEEAFDLVVKNGVLDYVRDLKKQGVIRHIGASSHNAAVAKKLVEQDIIETLMFSINAAYDLTGSNIDIMNKEDYDFERAMDPQRMALYQLCLEKGVGITVMKSLAAGKLLSADQTPFEKPMTVGQCIHYALSRPAVASVLVGCKTPEEVAAAMKYFELTEEEKDYSSVIRNAKDNMAGRCVYCSHCQPCPADIDIAAVHKYLDIALLDEANVPPSIRSHYDLLSAKGSQCIECGSCEEKCPFGVPVIGNMKKATQIFRA